MIYFELFINKKSNMSISRAIVWLLINFIPFLCPIQVEATAPLIVEKAPRSVFWSNVDSTWILATLFEHVEIKTFFNRPPPKGCLGISSDFLPVKQELLYRPTGHRFTTETCRFIQHLDGTKAWGFTYDATFPIEDKEYGNICVIISEKPEFDMFYLIAELKGQ